jgi:FKBP-type peptidyl-prolyl cis-trans isomerase
MKVEDYFKNMSEGLKKAEPAKINKFVADNKLNVTKTASGLNYVITKPGVGDKPVDGDSVEVNYVGKLLGGKVFDTNIKEEAVKGKMQISPMNPYKPIRIALGEKKVIAGWEEGLRLLNKGAKATFVIPSDLAYGEQGYGPIQPFTPITFDVEVTDIIHAGAAKLPPPAVAPNQAKK